jgi:hypothetical protein
MTVALLIVLFFLHINSSIHFYSVVIIGDMLPHH